MTPMLWYDSKFYWVWPTHSLISSASSLRDKVSGRFEASLRKTGFSSCWKGTDDLALFSIKSSSSKSSKGFPEDRVSSAINLSFLSFFSAPGNLLYLKIFVPLTWRFLSITVCRYEENSWKRHLKKVHSWKKARGLEYCSICCLSLQCWSPKNILPSLSPGMTNCTRFLHCTSENKR